MIPDDQASEKAPRQEAETARQALDRRGFGCDVIEEFRCFMDAAKQEDGFIEKRMAIAPLNGITQGGNGTQYVPESVPLFCSHRSDGNWLVEYCDGQQIVSAIVTEEKLKERTSRSA